MVGIQEEDVFTSFMSLYFLSLVFIIRVIVVVVNMSSDKYGTIMWARTDNLYWPAVTLPPSVRPKSHRKGLFWVFWFGDHRISEVNNSKTIKFQRFFSTRNIRLIGRNRPKWYKGVHEALKCYASADQANWNDEQLLDWALSGFDKTTPKNDEIPLPEMVFENMDIVNTYKRKHTKKSRNTRLLKTMDIQKLCLGCYKEDIVDKHPIFNGSVCADCKERLRETIFFIGPDQIHWCCWICGDYGDLLLCSKITCGSGYCTTCIDNLSARKIRKGIEDNDNWYCFVCDPDNRSYGFIVCREDWRETIQAFFYVKHHLAPTISVKKTKIRVLSLFDGISTALVSLNKMNLVVKHYYASEMDKHAIFISRKNFKDQITYMGDVRRITTETLKTILPIDLLIGGSPCEELSIANPKRKGVLGTLDRYIIPAAYGVRPNFTLIQDNMKPYTHYYELSTRTRNSTSCSASMGYFKYSEPPKYSLDAPEPLIVKWNNISQRDLINTKQEHCTKTGYLFFDFFRILITLKKENGSPFFWLYENVASMSALDKEIISSSFNMEPTKINASWVSPQNRNRLFWGNCPTLCGNFERDGPKLQEYLLPGRTATVDKIRTITTGSNSLIQGCKKPVQTGNNNEDTLHINEIERIFGFNDDYTMHERLSRTRRLEVLGKSWSVQVGCLLLNFLPVHYLQKGEEEDEIAIDNSFQYVVADNVKIEVEEGLEVNFDEEVDMVIEDVTNNELDDGVMIIDVDVVEIVDAVDIQDVVEDTDRDIDKTVVEDVSRYSDGR